MRKSIVKQMMDITRIQIGKNMKELSKLYADE